MPKKKIYENIFKSSYEISDKYIPKNKTLKNKTNNYK